MDTESQDFQDMINVTERIIADLSHASFMIDSFQALGYDHTFEILDKDHLVDEQRQLFKVRDFQLDDMYRFEPNTVLERYVIYAVRNRWANVKGILLVEHTMLSSEVR